MRIAALLLGALLAVPVAQAAVPVKSCADLGSADTEFDTAKLQACIDRNAERIGQLFTHFQEQNPMMSGSVALLMRITPAGEVTAIESKSRGIIDAKFEKLLVAFVRRITFPVSKSGYEGVYRLNFVPQ